MRFLFLVMMLGSTLLGTAQNKVAADKIIAAVGKSRIILSSELETEVMRQKQEHPEFTDSMRCALLQQMMMRKLLIEQAERDSVMVSPEEVDANLENRMRYYLRLYGSKERLEQDAGKTIYQIKEDFREPIAEQMIAEKMQGSLMNNVKVTPAEVRSFYDKQPKDSLPYFPATVEMGQIVIDPAVSPELDAYARQKLEDIRNQIVKDGKSFETMAGLYSDDNSGRDNGGDLGGSSRRADFVPEFAAAAFRLQNGEISPIVKTRFGYHIIQMVSRQGEEAHLRHILIRPERSSADYKTALNKLDSVRALLIAGTIKFPEAVAKYSTDESAKMSGGMVQDASTGATRLEVDKLEPAMALMIDSLTPGMYSQPQIFTKESGDRSTRIVFMRSRTEPHKANLVDDYAQIQGVALMQKKQEEMETWFQKKLPSYYIRIAPEFRSCPGMAAWGQKSPQ
ncbi:MAG: peptidylprolyl isomerase [Sphingobacteriales bacterium]|nr:MAG: peptidylprolyl isomerase [Sphingobacteriales bacterium]